MHFNEELGPPSHAERNAERRHSDRHEQALAQIVEATSTVCAAHDKALKRMCLKHVALETCASEERQRGAAPNKRAHTCSGYTWQTQCKSWFLLSTDGACAQTRNGSSYVSVSTLKPCQIAQGEGRT